MTGLSPRVAGWCVALFVLAGSHANAQEGGAAPAEGRQLSLAEALQVARGSSEQVVIAAARLAQAESDVARVRAARLPQVDANASYSRALASEFDGLMGGDGGPGPPPHCTQPFHPGTGMSAEERLRAVELELTCPPALGLGGIDFGDIGFGSENTYNLGLTFSVPVFTGGRLSAQSGVARAARDVAALEVAAAEADLEYEVTQAYFDAQLAERLLRIARSTHDQLVAVVSVAEVGAQSGTQAEFDVLRARVSVQNHLPVVIRREAQRDLAHDRLRLLLNLPLDEPLALTTELDAVMPAEMEPAADLERVTVGQAMAALRAVEHELSMARGQRLPSINLFSQYGQVAYSGVIPEVDDFRNNWNVGASLQLPIFSGGRIGAEVRAAEAGVISARAQLRRTQEIALLDTRDAIAQLEAARASWEASLGTVEQAEQAYSIAELRYSEGISSQLELTDSRVMLEEALANRATAARDLRVAETRVALLPFLPLGPGGGISDPARPGPSTVSPRVEDRRIQQLDLPIPTRGQRPQSGGRPSPGGPSF